MYITISSQHQERIRSKVESGLYDSPEQVISEALRLLDERDRYIAELRDKVKVAIEEIERGQYVEYTDENLHELFEQIEAEGLAELERRKKRAR
jgi:antitoxin ParD1/3/4